MHLTPPGSAASAARAAARPVDDPRCGAQTGTADTAAVPQVVFGVPKAAAAGPAIVGTERTGHRADVVDHDMTGVAGTHQYARAAAAGRGCCSTRTAAPSSASRSPTPA
ncbi:hypothetical protein ACFWJE_33910 [Streptomyces griseoincarnatus]